MPWRCDCWPTHTDGSAARGSSGSTSTTSRRAADAAAPRRRRRRWRARCRHASSASCARPTTPSPLTLDGGFRPGGFQFPPGQFNMVYAFGVGEVPLSLSGDPDRAELVVHTIRVVGGVTRALRACGAAKRSGCAAPSAIAWPLAEARGRDVLLVAGGLGMAPLRPAIYRLLQHRPTYGRVVRRLWRTHARGAAVRPRAGALGAPPRPRAPPHRRPLRPRWAGAVGTVTDALARLELAPAHTIAFVCGPEPMMRFVGRALLRPRPAGLAHPPVARAQHAVWRRPLRPLPARPAPGLPRRAGGAASPRPHAALDPGDLTVPRRRPPASPQARRLEAHLLRRLPADPAVVHPRAAPARRRLRDRAFPELTPRRRARSLRPVAGRGLGGTAARSERVQAIRRASKRLVAIGACATAGGVQALRNRLPGAPRRPSTRTRSARRARHLDAVSAHVRVDDELPGLPNRPPPAARRSRRGPAPQEPRLPRHPSASTASASGYACVTGRPTAPSASAR